MSILYIDDDPDDREIFQEAVKLVDPSIQFLTSPNGEDALVFLDQARELPDHIVMDINMPGMDGKSCLQKIRKERKFDSIHITLYSTSSFHPDIEEIESLDATFVKKANSFKDLCTMISELLGKRQAGGR